MFAQLMLIFTSLYLFIFGTNNLITLKNFKAPFFRRQCNIITRVGVVKKLRLVDFGE